MRKFRCRLTDGISNFPFVLKCSLTTSSALFYDPENMLLYIAFLDSLEATFAHITCGKYSLLNSYLIEFDDLV